MAPQLAQTPVFPAPTARMLEYRRQEARQMARAFWPQPDYRTWGAVMRRRAEGFCRSLPDPEQAHVYLIDSILRLGAGAVDAPLVQLQPGTQECVVYPPNPRGAMLRAAAVRLLHGAGYAHPQAWHVIQAVIALCFPVASAADLG